MRVRWDIRCALAMILLAAVVLILPACGSAGVKEAQAARNSHAGAAATDETQPAPPDRDDEDLAGDAEVPKPAPAKPAPAAPSAKKPTPSPTAVRLTVPTNAEMEVEIITPLSSETSKPGDTFSARVNQAVMIGNQVAIPAGAEATGHVTEAIPTKKIGGQARLTLMFETLALPGGGGSAPLTATLTTEGKKQTKKDTGTIAGATAGGALLGRVLAKDKQKGTAIGAVVGAAAGTTIAANNATDPVNFAQGTIVPLTLQEPIFVVLTGNHRRFATAEER